MNDLFLDKLRHLNEDSAMLEAIKFLINERIEKEKPVIEITDGDQTLGQKYRAYMEAKKLFEKILIDIDAFRDKKVELGKINKGK